MVDQLKTSRTWAEIQAAYPIDEEAAFEMMLDSPKTRRQNVAPRIWLGNQCAAGGLTPVAERTPKALAEIR